MFDQTDLSTIPGIDAVLAPFNSSASGMKLVYACTVGGHKEAVKVVKIADGAGIRDTDILRLRRELDLLDDLTSPYLPDLGSLPIQRFTKGNDTYIIYSEKFIEGSDVCEMIDNDRFSDPAMVTKLIQNVASALKTFWGHERTVHRDVKPANIRYSNDTSNFILIDPGIALVRDRITITPTGFGSPRTPPYAAPEVIRNDRNLSFRTDLFCLGVTSYEAASGRHPFLVAGMSEQQLYSAILSTDPPDIATLRPDLPTEVAIQIMKMLNKRPHQRPLSLEQLINLGAQS